MAHTPEMGGARPAWKRQVTEYEQLAAGGYLPASTILALGAQMLGDLLVRGDLPNLGELQTHLYAKESIVQLTAWLFDPGVYPGCICMDPRTREVRSYQVVITVGLDESPFGRQLAAKRQDREQNVSLLRDHTGIVTLLR